MSIEAYAFCGANCKHRVLTIDQTVELIQEMAANGFQVPEGFIPTTAVNAIVEQNTGKELKLFVGTQAQYNAWTGDKTSVFAIITDDPTAREIFDRFDNLENVVDEISDGTMPVSVKKNDGSMGQITEDANGVLKYEGKIIPQTKELWRNDKGASSASWNEELKVGDIVEVTYKLWNTIKTTKGVITSGSTTLDARVDFSVFTTMNYYQTAYIAIKATSAEIVNMDTNYQAPQTPLMYKIVKVIG